MAAEMPCSICLMTKDVDHAAFAKMGSGDGAAFEAGVAMGWVMNSKGREHDLFDVAEAAMCLKHRTIAAMVGAFIDVQFTHAKAEAAPRHSADSKGKT